MAKWPGGPCPGCAHSHGSTSCNVCGGGTGYPELASPQLMDPCDTCIDSIGTTTQLGGPMSSTVDPDAPTEILTIEPGAFSPTLTSGTQIESWRGLASEFVTMLGRVAINRGAERANQVALILHKQLRDEMDR